MAAKRINLKGVQAEIARVRRQIEALRAQVDPAERGILDKKITQMETLARTTGALCTRAWGAWPLAMRKTSKKRGPAKSRRKK